MSHDSFRAEQFAGGIHVVWAVVCMVSGIFAAAGFVQVEPLAHLPGPIGNIFFIEALQQMALAVLGIGGAIWHVWGAREHLRRAKADPSLRSG